ncbi:WD40 repeat domain-containing protein, partial [Microcoleus sp. ARI1-A4]
MRTVRSFVGAVALFMVFRACFFSGKRVNPANQQLYQTNNLANPILETAVSDRSFSFEQTFKDLRENPNGGFKQLNALGETTQDIRPQVIAAPKPANNATLTGHSGVVTSVAFSPDGKTLASAGGSTIKLWNLQNQKELATLTGHSSVAFSPDGKTLAS